MSENGKSVAVDWLNSSGEMGKVIRMDWSKTPLGPIESWSQSLRTTVSLCLASNFPINIIWGPGRVQIYNDGYWPMCGDKHPHSMGQNYKECWFSAWDALGEAFESASAGKTAFLENRTGDRPSPSRTPQRHDPCRKFWSWARCNLYCQATSFTRMRNF